MADRKVVVVYEDGRVVLLLIEGRDFEVERLVTKRPRVRRAARVDLAERVAQALTGAGQHAGRGA